MYKKITSGPPFYNFIKKFLKKNAVLILGILFVLLNLYASESLPVKHEYILGSDGRGYYNYLPYTFIKHDVAHQDWSALQPNGNSMNKFTMGVAILEIPFFFGAHLYSLISGLPAGGYSPPYTYALLISVALYVFLGLYFLFKFLKPKFGKTVSLIVVIVLYYATNLYHYTVYEPAMSHGYSFFLLALFVYSLDFFIQAPKMKNAIACGIPLALAVLIRPTNILYALLFILYDVYSFRALIERLRFIFMHIKYYLMIIFIGILFFTPQILYWSYTSGHFTIYSYVSKDYIETFKYLTSPKIYQVLLGVESGWLIYSPVFIFFFVGLFICLFKKINHSFGILLIFLIILYLNASWWAYTFSCSFGYRSLIEYYPLCAIPIAYLFSKIFNRKKIVPKIAMIFLLTVFSFFNVRIAGFYYKEPCWSAPEWTWVNYNKIINNAFYIKSYTSVKQK